jgi:2-polyprenyl-3-methyl-5-hydroxy-6-metoxy-1,4-benzoquinol methylase
MDNPEIDSAKSDAFADRMIDMLNYGALALMTSIGHRSGLFDTMKNMKPATSDEIAEAAGLNERYVREWLGAMVTGGVIECDPKGLRYVLPREHSNWLTRDASPNNIAVFAQYVSELGSVENHILSCFRNGGGVPYSEYRRFHEIMAEDSGQTVVAALMDSILPLVPGLIDQLKKGIDVLDVGCGSGRALNLMAKNFPNSRFVGYDLSPEALNTSRMEAEKEVLKNVCYDEKDLTDFDVPGRFDLITAFDAIHDQARPDQVLAGIFKSLKTGGVFLMQDIAASSQVYKNIGHPVGPLLYTISCMHCMSVSLEQNGAGLGAMWGKEKAKEMLSEAGFSDIRIKQLPHDFQNYFYIMKKIAQ